MRLNLNDIDDLGDTLCVAVSGGADSLALCLLAHDWAMEHQRKIQAVSVDHGLRPASAKECKWVADVLQSYGIPHQILVWVGEKPSSDVQAKARAARYDLIENWCQTQGIRDVLLAHHLDDQAETFMLRLARGSGVDGLSAMAPVQKRGAIRLLRPLLDTPKADLIAYLNRRHQDWIEDPSNQNIDFDRVKMRQNMPLLAELGLSAERLAQTAKSMQRVRSTLESLVANWLDANASFHELGYMTFNHAALCDGDEEVVLRALVRIGQRVSGEIYPPRFEKLCRLHEKLKKGEDATFRKCRWMRRGADILVCREVRSQQVPESLYNLTYEGDAEGVNVAMLGEKGWLAIKKNMPELEKMNIEKPLIYATLALWDKEGVLVVPHLGYKREDAALDAEIKFLCPNDVFS